MQNGTAIPIRYNIPLSPFLLLLKSCFTVALGGEVEVWEVGSQRDIALGLLITWARRASQFPFLQVWWRSVITTPTHYVFIQQLFYKHQRTGI